MLQALPHSHSWDVWLFPGGPMTKGLPWCQNVTVLIAASPRSIPILFPPSYLKTQSQKCLWLHTGNQTTAWWLWPIFLSQHMSVWQHCLESPGVFQAARTVDTDSRHWEWPSQPLQSDPNKIWIWAAVVLIRWAGSGQLACDNQRKHFIFSFSAVIPTKLLCCWRKGKFSTSPEHPRI